MSSLSPRLQLIYQQLLPGKPVWDMCCDHGYVGLQAYTAGLFPEVHFVDRVETIVQSLEERFLREHFNPASAVKVFFRAESAESVSERLSGTVIIAGVGGYTIGKIIRGLLSNDQLKADRLILSPQKAAPLLDDALCEINQLGFILCNEHYEIRERGRSRKLLILNKN